MTTEPQPSTPDNPGGQQVSWWSVHEFVDQVVKQVNGWPMLGTPAWCSLAHDDPRKWAALLDGAQHHALRIETAQQARADASRAVSTAVYWDDSDTIATSVPWSEIARRHRSRAAFRATRPWAKRVPS